MSFTLYTIPHTSPLSASDFEARLALPQVRQRYFFDLVRTLALSLFLVVGAAVLLKSIEEVLVPRTIAVELPKGIREELRYQGAHVAERPLLWRVLGVETAHAHPLYAAELVTVNPKKLTLAPGEEGTVTVKFKNSGAAAWKRKSARFISAYTVEPNYRESGFAHERWFGKTQPALVSEARVAPGELGSLTLHLRAPHTTGTFVEHFRLAAEDHAWVDGGTFSINITVKGGADSASYDAQKKSSLHKASLLLISHREVVGKGGSAVALRAGFKNNGSTEWHALKFIEPGVALAAAEKKSAFAHSSWTGDTLVFSKAGVTVPPGTVTFIDFQLTLPQTVGSHTARFALIVDDEEVDGGTIELPITVTSPGDAPADTVTEPLLGEEPRLRVGITTVEGIMPLLAHAPYEVRNVVGELIDTLQSGERAEAQFDPALQMYLWKRGTYTTSSPTYLRITPSTPDAGTVTIESYERRPKWNIDLNDNRFRDTIEFRLTDTGKVWLINELPFEMYVRGIAEISNNSPVELHKSQAIAARTYALYYHERGGKHKGEPFTLNAGAYDQVYRGYNAEMRHPTFATAADATRGFVVTYNDETAVTPYFARSDGRTRSWAEVWGGAGKPYLLAKEAQYDKGRTLWGHGVGMPQSDARARAEAGATHDQILKHYYTGVELKKKW